MADLSLKKIPVDLIVFDLDGTLADSVPDLTTAANYALRTLRLPERSEEAIKGMIGGGERMFMERLLGPERRAQVEDCLTIYLDYYSRHCRDLTRLYAGVPETLERLSGKKLAVLSNKLHRLTEQILTALGIVRFFDASRGGGAGLPLKPAPEPLLALIRDLQVEAGRTLMVGDKPADVNCARGAGVHSAAVTYGYGDRESLEAASPEFILDHFAQVLEIIK